MSIFGVDPSSPSGLPPRPGVAGGDRGRLILLGVFFLLVMGMLAGFVLMSSSLGKKPPAPAAEGSRAAPRLSENPLEIVPEPLDPDDEAADVEAGLMERMAEFKDIVDGVPAVDPVPFTFLLDQVSLNARVMNLQKIGFDRGADLAALAKDPSKSRGKLLSVSGVLLSLAREPHATESGLVKEIRRGAVRDGAGRIVTFTWAVANPLEPDPVAPGDGWVRVEGILYKSWPWRDEAGAEVATPHLVLQRRPARDYPPAQYRDVDPAWLDEVHDATPAEMVVRDEDALYRLLNLSRTLGPDGFDAWGAARQAESPGLKLWPPEDMSGRYKELIDRPDLYRLKPVVYHGYIAKPSRIADNEIRPNAGNIEKVWIAFLVDQDFAPAVWVYSHRSFADMGLDLDERVKVEGFFLKRVAYEPAGGGKDRPMMRAAVIVATRISQAAVGKKPWDRTVVYAVFGGMLLLAAFLGWAIWQGRREDEASLRRRREKIEQRRAKAKAAAAPPPPPAGA